ncbi:MAG TPA: hypothetical protein VM123_01410, partial [archaeon]|nr:hypothetical protein [archaeon]
LGDSGWRGLPVRLPGREILLFPEVRPGHLRRLLDGRVRTGIERGGPVVKISDRRGTQYAVTPCPRGWAANVLQSE